MKTVLIVDDNEANRYLLKSLLEGNGLKAVTAENGRVALSLALDDPPDLIVSDILMPDMDGYAFCRECKANERLAKIPFVFYTATYTEPKDERFALSLGADRFLIKPQKPEELLRLLMAFLTEESVRPTSRPKPLGDEMEFFRTHNEILFAKLEEKMADLEAANRKLAAFGEKYRLSFVHASDVILTIGPDLRVDSMSPSVERILGYSPGNSSACPFRSWPGSSLRNPLFGRWPTRPGLSAEKRSPRRSTSSLPGTGHPGSSRSAAPRSGARERSPA